MQFKSLLKSKQWETFKVGCDSYKDRKDLKSESFKMPHSIHQSKIGKDQKDPNQQLHEVKAQLTHSQSLHRMNGDCVRISNPVLYQIGEPCITDADAIQRDIDIAHYVIQTGKINALQAKIPLRSNWNIRLFWSLCNSDSNIEVATYLQYGWPLGRLQGPVSQTYGNHPTALRHPKQVWKYLLKEKKLGTLLSPFVTSPFAQDITGVSPM